MSIPKHMKLFDTRAEITKFVTDSNGVRKSVLTWARILGMKPDTIRKRMKRTDDPDVILATHNLHNRRKNGYPPTQ